jgi:hypothetical protein
MWNNGGIYEMALATQNYNVVWTDEPSPYLVPNQFYFVGVTFNGTGGSGVTGLNFYNVPISGAINSTILAAHKNTFSFVVAGDTTTRSISTANAIKFGDSNPAFDWIGWVGGLFVTNTALDDTHIVTQCNALQTG